MPNGRAVDIEGQPPLLLMLSAAPGLKQAGKQFLGTLAKGDGASLGGGSGGFFPGTFGGGLLWRNVLIQCIGKLGGFGASGFQADRARGSAAKAFDMALAVLGADKQPGPCAGLTDG